MYFLSKRKSTHCACCNHINSTLQNFIGKIRSDDKKARCYLHPQLRAMAAAIIAIPPKMETTDSNIALRPKRRAPSMLPCCRLFRD